MTSSYIKILMGFCSNGVLLCERAFPKQRVFAFFQLLERGQLLSSVHHRKECLPRFWRRNIPAQIGARKYSQIRLFPPNSSVQEILILKKLIWVGKKNIADCTQHLKKIAKTSSLFRTSCTLITQKTLLVNLNLTVIEPQLHLLQE